MKLSFFASEKNLCILHGENGVAVSLITVRCCFVTKLERAKKIHEVTMFGGDSQQVDAVLCILAFT